MTLRSAHCFFDAFDRRHGRNVRAGSLFEAALAMGDATSADGRPNAHSPSVIQALATPNGHREPLDGSKTELHAFAKQHGLKVAGVSTASW